MEVLNSEILRALSSRNAIWDRCCGPNGNGVDSSTLLTILQNQDPQSNWDAATLNSLLLLGQRQGRVKQLPSDVWYLNNAMILVNAGNKVYRGTSSAICTPAGCRRIATTFV